MEKEIIFASSFLRNNNDAFIENHVEIINSLIEQKEEIVKKNRRLENKV